MYIIEKVHEVNIYHQNVTLKDCTNKDSDYIYWNQLIQCLLQPSEKLPSRPETWNRQRQSSRNKTWTKISPPTVSPPRRRKESPPTSPPRTHKRVPTHRM